jgi:gluconate kinase
MKMLNAGEVQQVSGGDGLPDIDFIEWLRQVEEAMRRNNTYGSSRD